VAYTPDWEPLAHALKRIMRTGASEDEAKIDLCRAVADRKIDVRVRIAATDYAMRGRVFSGGNVRVPAHLDPRDFDWVQSRPLAQWSIGPKLGEHYYWISGWENRPLDLIELSTDDVMNILCSGNAAPPARRVGGVSKSGRGAKARGVEEAISQLWSDQIPKGLSAKDRNRAILDRMKQNGSSIPSKPERAIQRVLQKRQPQ
jgi:hypothetical protein